MSPLDYYIKVIHQYADFEGRARRAEYWNYVWINIVAVIACIMPIFIHRVFVFIPFLYLVGTFIPSLAVAIRRLHDTNKSGWWYLLSFVPMGGIVLFIFMVIEGDDGDNDYGPDPKEEEYYEEAY